MAFSDFIPKFLSDPYDRPARLYPGLLVVLPLAVLLAGLYGTTHNPASVVLPVLGFCGAGYLLGRLSRDAGKRIQERLFVKWGGAPTTQLLRHRNTVFDEHTKERFHNTIAKGIGKSFPTREAEQLDPVAADELYRAGTTWLIGQTRNTKIFPLVFNENIAFGFHRNCLGVRTMGIIATTISIAWALLHAEVLRNFSPYVSPQRLLSLEPGAAVALCVAVAMLSVWLFLLNEASAKRTAFAYAERLLQSCDQLKLDSTRAKSPAKKGAEPKAN
jgi:hypothetical protein